MRQRRKIAGVSQNRRLVIPRHAVFTTIDRRIEIDQMRARMAAGNQIDRYVSVAVKTAGVTHYGVVVGHRERIVELSPADAFDLQSNPASAAQSSRRRGKHRLRDLESLVLNLF